MGLVYDLPSKVYRCKCGRFLSLESQGHYDDDSVYSWLTVITGVEKGSYIPGLRFTDEHLDQFELKPTRVPSSARFRPSVWENKLPWKTVNLAKVSPPIEEVKIAD
jgi:hypothetical protein